MLDTGFWAHHHSTKKANSVYRRQKEAVLAYKCSNSLRKWLRKSEAL
jgi:hypothetical protein